MPGSVSGQYLQIYRNIIRWVNLGVSLGAILANILDSYGNASPICLLFGGVLRPL